MPTNTGSSSAKGIANFVPLPSNYVPHPHDVIIGRGRRANKHNENNTILQYLLNSYAAEYVDCTRDRKSELITSVAQEIRTHNGTFIKKVHKKGGWYAVDDDLIRITTAQYLRNQVPQNFKSSKQFKRQMRDEKRQEKLAGATGISTSGAAGPDTIVAGACTSSSEDSLDWNVITPCTSSKAQVQLDHLVGTVRRVSSCPNDHQTTTKLLLSPKNEPRKELECSRELQPKDLLSIGSMYLQRSFESAHYLGVLEDQLDVDLDDPNPYEPMPITSMFLRAGI